MTQQMLADAVGYSRSTLANVESGRQRAALAFWQACDRVLTADGDLEAGFQQIEDAVRDQRRAQAVEAQRLREAHVHQLRASGTSSTPGHVGRKPHVDQGSEAITAVIRQATTSEEYPEGGDRLGVDDLEHRVLTAYQEHRRESGKLSLTLVGGYAGSGKSEFARFLSAVTGWTILDKDTLTRALVEQLLLAYGGDLNDRHSPLYLEKVRQYEYRCLVDSAVENLKAGVSTVLTAPFLREFNDKLWVQRVQNRCRGYGANFSVVWVKCDPESMFDYISYRGAARDTWKLANWSEYLAGVDTEFEPEIAHYTVNNQLNATVAIADQAVEIARSMQS